MIKAISEKLYLKLSGDATLTGLLPSVKDSTNIWEMRVPNSPAESQFPVVVFRVVTGAPVLTVRALNAVSWFIEINIIGREASLEDLWVIYNRIYALLEDSDLSSGEKKSLRCSLDFVNTEYDANTLLTYILTRWQIISYEAPSSKLSEN